MSSIKIKKILSFSSQDETFKAANLLDGSEKWISSKDGDTKQFVIFQLNESNKIKEVDIENESSAFIEILVGNLDDSEDDYQVLLPAISFMSPNESKTSTNTKRVKIITNETNLDKTLSEKKWEVVKIVCTQPFNTEIQFGLSSIKFFNEIVNENVKDAAKINAGIFSLRKELSASEDRKKDSEQKDEEKKTESIYEKWKREKENKKAETDVSPKDSKDSKRKLSTSDDEEKEKKPETKKQNHEKVNSPKKVPSEQILKGIIFALSGFQNPLRSEIRDAGLKLGAKYRPDWTDDCTHLITAFSNTPKVAQVRKTSGIIVTKDWIFDCKKEKKLLDCDDYKLVEESDDEDFSKPRKAARAAKKNLKNLNKRDEYDDSYDEEEAENSDDKDFIVGSSEEEEIESSSSSSSEEEEEGESSDSEDSNKKKKSKPKKKKSKKVSKEKTKKRKSKSSSKSSDSESDLEEYMKKKKKEILSEKKTKKTDKTKTNENKKKEIKYDDSDEEKKPERKKIKKENSSLSTKTDVNSDMEVENNEKISWELPSFFDDKKFFIHGDFNTNKRKQLSKIIYAYGGEVNDYMSNDVTYIISDKKWNKEFQESLDENPKLKFIESDWLEACHKKKKLIPFGVFEITKD